MLPRNRTHALVLVLPLSGCLVSRGPERPYQERSEIHYDEAGAPKKSKTRDDSPEISRSVGDPNGIVILWPRIAPRTDDAAVQELAGLVQSRLRALASERYREQVDVRPAPERVCPRQGCRAPTLSAVVTVKGESCAVIATFAPAGTSATRLVPWVGGAEVKGGEVPFREPPESYATITDFAKCATLRKALSENAPLGNDAAVAKAIAELRP